MNAVQARSSNDTLRSPCCRNAWFHRNCIQRYAATAGAYFFKCPLCNNKELFEAEMLEFGIYIPEQDAAWEQEPNAFHDLLERYSHCDAENCLCPQGRAHSGAAGTRWEIWLCDWCGSSGSHFNCHGLSKINKDNVCIECAEISTIIESGKKSKKHKSSNSPPRVALSAEEVRQQLAQRRSASLRALRAARRHQSTSPSSDDNQPSGSGTRVQRRRHDSGSESNTDSSRTPVASPTLLKDTRLVACTPVVRMERAETEADVNVIDSDEDEGTSGSFSFGESCARLRGFHASRSHGTVRVDAESEEQDEWAVKRVIERGSKKVVLLSMHSKPDSSSDSSDVDQPSRTRLQQHGGK